MTKKIIPLFAIACTLLGACAESTREQMGVEQYALDSKLETAPILVPINTPAVENWTWTLADAHGGRLQDAINGHEIKIMPKTVSEPTYFVMHTLPGNYIHLDLTAWRRVAGAWVQVFTFDSDGVKLRVSYQNTDVKQANRLRVVYLPDNSLTGKLELLHTLVDKTNKQAQAKLSHFSQYTMALD